MREASGPTAQRSPDFGADSPALFEKADTAAAGQGPTRAQVGFDFSRIRIHPRIPATRKDLASDEPSGQWEQYGERVWEPQPGAPVHLQATRIGGVPAHGPQGAAAHENKTPPIVSEVVGSMGEPLDAAARALMEPRFGRDLSTVRIHNDFRSAQSARAVDALAYTVGKHVVFGAGQYSPASDPGQELIAHELTHVLQQSAGAAASRPGSQGLALGDPDDSFEREANRVASLVAGDTASPSSLWSTAGARVQRQTARAKPAAKPNKASLPVVEDGVAATRGQMHKSQFLSTLRETLLAAVDAELAPVGRSSKGCPYILRTIEYYAGRPVASLLRLVQAFGKPPKGADAHGLIHAVTGRARDAARRLAATSKHRVHAKANTENGVSSHDVHSVRSQLGRGQPLQGSVRMQMEQSFGTNFGAVRVHADATAARLNTELGARAFTIGNDIAFGDGFYQPGTPSGDALIAHELAHTWQQAAGREDTSSGASDAELERQADRAAIGALGGRAGIGASLDPANGGMKIQRDPVTDVVLAGALLLGSVGTEVAVTTTAVVIVAGPEIESELPVLEQAGATLVSEAPVLINEGQQLVNQAPDLVQEGQQLVSQAPDATQAVSTAVAATAAATATMSGDGGGPVPAQPKEEDDERKKSPVVLYRSGNASGPAPPRKDKDIPVDQQGNVRPFHPPLLWPDGASTFADINMLKRGNPIWAVPKAVVPLSPGLAAIADGSDVGGPRGRTHHTIFTFIPMAYGAFVSAVRSLPWIRTPK